MRRTLALVAALVLLAGCGTGLERKPPTRLPAVTLPAFSGHGAALDLATLKGPVVLSSWAQSCGPCRTEMGYFQQFHLAHPEVRLIGINTLDTQPQLAQKLLMAKGATYSQVVDRDGKTLRGRYLPQLTMVDAKGHVVYRKAVQIHSVAELTRLVDAHLKSADG